MRRLAMVLVLVGCGVLVGGCGLTDLFENDEPEHWAHASVGYPFTAYLAVQDSIRRPDGEWIKAPDPAILREATQVAIERWSRALGATAPVDILRNGRGNEVIVDLWGVPLPDTLTGFHLVIYFGSYALGWHQGTQTAEDGRPLIGVIGLSYGWEWDANGVEPASVTIAHEIGHALGFRVHFDHQRVIDFVNARSGSRHPVASRLPVTGSHWEDCMIPDLMTRTAEVRRRGETAHISDITIEAMPYPWKYRATDVEYTLPPTPSVCWREGRGEGRPKPPAGIGAGLPHRGATGRGVGRPPAGARSVHDARLVPVSR